MANLNKNKSAEKPFEGNVNLLRAGAIALWVAAFAFELVAFLIFIDKISIRAIATSWQLIAAFMVDLALVVYAGQLWKKANDSEPSDPNRKINYWMRRYMRVIAYDVCFFPFALFDIISKTASKSAKKVAYIVVVVLLVITNVINFDYNAVTAQQKENAISTITEKVYWTAYGELYHTDKECTNLNQQDKTTTGTVEAAFKANRDKLCAVCAEADGITDIATAE